MHLLYGVSLLCQVARLWGLSRRISQNSVKAKFVELAFYALG
jgi:hypothetical protein